VSGAKQLPYAVKAPFFWFVFFGAAKKMKRLILRVFLKNRHQAKRTKNIT